MRSVVIRAMPGGHVGTIDGIDMPSSDDLARYRQTAVTISVDGIRSRRLYAHRYAKRALKHDKKIHKVADQQGL